MSKPNCEMLEKGIREFEIVGNKRKLKEEELREFDEKYRSVMDNIKIGILLISPNMEILYLNKQMKEWFPNVDDSKNPICYQVFNNPQKEGICINCPANRTLKDGQVHEDLKYTLSSSKIRNYKVMSYPLEDKEGKVLAAIEIVEDITEQKRAEKKIFDTLEEFRQQQAEILESEERFRSIAQTENKAIISVDSCENIISWNNGAQNIFGYSKEEMLGKSLTSLIHEEYRSAYRKELELISSACKSNVFGKKVELYGLKKDGSEFPLELLLASWKTEKGTFYTSVIRDIVERKKTDEKIRQQNGFLENILESMTHPFYVIDVNDYTVEMANSAARLNSSFKSSKCYELIYKRKEPCRISGHTCLIEEVKRTKKSVTVEHVYNDKYGETKFFEVHGYPIFDNKGNIVQIIKYDLDITNRKSTEDALRESEGKLRSILENTPDNIMTVNRNGTILYITRTPPTLAVEDVIGTNSFEYIPLDFRERYRRALERVFQDGESDWFQHTTVGGLWWISRFVPIKWDGKAASALIISTDITERMKTEEEKKKLEEQLFQSQKMESIGRLAGGIAHDFNNILTNIMGYAEMLRIQFEDTTTTEGKAAEVIFRNAERAADLTLQLLGFAQGGKYNPFPLNVNNVIRDVIKVSEKIFEKNIKVKYEFEDKINTIEADRNQLDQVLTNIIINAKDAMPNGGELIFKTENVYLGKEYARRYHEFKRGYYVKVSITDTGIGIPKEVKDHIFEPFYTTKGKGKGTGLGLATVYGIIKNHSGCINCYSEPERGTTFTIYLPVSKKEIIERHSDIKVIRGNETILVVDDEEDVRNLAKKQLENLGYKVILARDGIEAVEIYKKEKGKIDLVLLDMIMPNIAGKETYCVIKKINPEVKVLLTSGFSQNGKASEILQEGVIGFIQKPFKLCELSKVIYEALRGLNSFEKQK